MLEPPGIALLARRVAVTHLVSRILFGSSGSELNAADEETRLREAAGGRRLPLQAAGQAANTDTVSAPPAHDVADCDSPDRGLGSVLPSPPVHPVRSGPAPSRLLGPRPSVLGRPKLLKHRLTPPRAGRHTATRSLRVPRSRPCPRPRSRPCLDPRAAVGHLLCLKQPLTVGHRRWPS